MKKDDLMATLEAISKSGINVAGDLVLEKHVEHEVANVEPGGIGIQNIFNGFGMQKPDEELQASQHQPVTNNKERNEELFHFVYPELSEAEAWRIHDAVKRVVKLQGMQMICQYLTQLKNEKKVLLPPNPSTAYIELVRMGMPDGEGFNETTFRKYYNK